MLPPPVSIGFPGSFQQQQQNNMHRTFKSSRRPIDSLMVTGGGATGSTRNTKGEFVSINLHRASDSTGSNSGIIQGNNMAVSFTSVDDSRQKGTHHDRRYSLDSNYQQQSSGDGFDNDGSTAIDMKARDTGSSHPMMLQGQSSRQTQDNIKYARVIAKSGSSSLKTRTSNYDSSVDKNTGAGSNGSNVNITGSSNSGGSGSGSNAVDTGSNSKDMGTGRSPLHRQTLVSSSKFHKWPSVGRSRQSRERKQLSRQQKRNNNSEKGEGGGGSGKESGTGSRGEFARSNSSRTRSSSGIRTRKRRGKTSTGKR
jgi:hypothetical protein